MFLFARCLHLLVKNIHQGQERINDESWSRKEINLCLAALLCDQLLLICESFDFTAEWFADFEYYYLPLRPLTMPPWAKNSCESSKFNLSPCFIPK